jgi:hypothetical protein
MFSMSNVMEMNAIFTWHRMKLRAILAIQPLEEGSET